MILVMMILIVVLSWLFVWMVWMVLFGSMVGRSRVMLGIFFLLEVFRWWWVGIFLIVVFVGWWCGMVILYMCWLLIILVWVLIWDCVGWMFWLMVMGRSWVVLMLLLFRCLLVGVVFRMGWMGICKGCEYWVLILWIGWEWNYDGMIYYL